MVLLVLSGMVIVMMKITMQAAILMVVTAVGQMLTPNIVMNVFVINKLECLKDCCVLILYNNIGKFK
jgi:hypothetical protein